MVEISVIICSYNHENYISFAIESVIKQCCNVSFEILVGDDCSTDNTRAILNEYYNRFPHLIRLVYPPKNIGATKNLINLIKHANGKYVAILDGDDEWIDTLKLQKQYNILESDANVGMVCSSALKWDQSRKKYIGKLGTNIVTNLELLLCSDTDVAAPTMFMNKSLLLDCINDSTWYIINNCFFDSIITYWFALNSKILYIDEDLALYRVLSNSGCHTTDKAIEIKYSRRAFSIKCRFMLEKNIDVDLCQRVLLSEWNKLREQSIWIGENNIRMSYSYKLGNFLFKPFKFLKSLFIK